MSVARTLPSLPSVTVSPLERAILETLAYSDIFEYPLTLNELHRYLSLSISFEELESRIPYNQSLPNRDGYYHLPGRDEVVGIRKGRESDSRRAFHRAVRYGKILARLPFVRMAAMTGSLAVLNLSKSADMDFMLVTAPNRLWLARAFAVTFGRLMRLAGDRICVNLLVSENALEWPRHDLYSARELGQMVPIAGMDVYLRLRAANPWAESILPNAASAPEPTPQTVKATGTILQRIMELPFRGRFGEWLDRVLMNIQLRKISRKYGTGAETNFTVDVCQGNFHDHRKWADEYFRARLVSLGLEEANRR